MHFSSAYKRDKLKLGPFMGYEFVAQVAAVRADEPRAGGGGWKNVTTWSCMHVFSAGHAENRALENVFGWARAVTRSRGAKYFGKGWPQNGKQFLLALMTSWYVWKPNMYSS